MTDIVIVSAARTAIGSFLGTLRQTPAVKLGSHAIKHALNRIDLDPKQVDEVIMGHVLTSGLGQNTARQAAMGAHIDQSATAMTINQVCGSGLRSVALGLQSIMTQQADIVVAGGQENMSQSPHVSFLRSGVKMGPSQLTDSMIQDGLWCAFENYHMGNTAENIAEKFGISRQEQDEFALQSQNKAQAAQEQGKFKDEIAPFTIKTRKEEIVFQDDEFIRHNARIEQLEKLRPAFPEGKSVTAGNASGINDGAGALVLMTAQRAQELNLTPLGHIRSWATAGVEPSIMGTGPVPACQKALKKAGWNAHDLDLIEANEAFAAQAISVNRQMEWDCSKVNVNGGAIAIGHPIGASGARVLITLLFEMQKRQAQKGLATLCIGGGMGIALTIERN